MLASDFVPKEGISLLGVDGVPKSAGINPLLSIKLGGREGRGKAGKGFRQVQNRSNEKLR